MNGNRETAGTELDRRHRSAMLIVIGFLALTLVLLAVAFFGTRFIYRSGDPSLVMGLRIAVLVFGLGAFVLRRTRFNATRLKDIAAVKGASGLIKTLQDTTIQVASIGGAIALMGFMMTILTKDWTEMLRSAGVAIIVLIYCYPFKNAWQRAVNQLAPEG
jgi:hypothetical protein